MQPEKESRCEAEKQTEGDEADSIVNMKSFLDCSLERVLVVDILSVVFGLGSWIAMTGLWVELPVLVQKLPEGWTLASYLSLILQVANVGPIVYGIMNRWCPRWMNERIANHGQLAIGSVSTLLLIFFWTSTADIGGKQCSIALFVLSFGLSIVDCTSSVTFLPYMSHFRSIYLTPYLIGEGLSGLLPSLMAIGQGIENPDCINTSTITVLEDGTNLTEFIMVPLIKEPRFTAEWFFVFLLAMVLISWMAFVLLDKLPICAREMVPEYSGVSMSTDAPEKNAVADGHPCQKTQDIQLQELPSGEACEVAFRTSSTTAAHHTRSSQRATYMYLLFLQGWASISTFGVFPAIQTYSCLPYGQHPFHLAVTLSGIAYPVACMVAMFFEVRSIRWVSVLSMLATLISVYIMTTAVLSPKPPLVSTEVGSTLVVVSWVLFVGLFSYVKTMVTILLGDIGHEALFWCGAVTQAGAAIGALLMFLLVNVFELFQDDGLCIV